MDNERIRTWGPVTAILLLLPLMFVLLRLWFAPIGPRQPRLQPAPPIPVEPLADPQPRDGRQGKASCEGCHPEESKTWSTSTHALAERPLSDPALSILLADGTLMQSGEAVRPIRAIGMPPVVQFLVPRDGGRLQVTSMAYDPAGAEWFDVFGEERQPGEWGHWTGGGMTWNAQCAGCHSTGVTKGWDEASASYRTEVSEHGVTCAACHGDLPTHDAAFDAPAPDMDRCAACHSRRADLTGQFVPGERFLDHFAPQLVDTSETFWPDGQVREEDFEWTAFEGSAMHDKGVTCINCHDPHSGKLRAEGDALCLGCHSALPGFTLHDKHPTDTKPQPPSCVDCHMPVTTYMQRDRRHDHGFVIPDPWTAVNLGIPDPCTRCHAELTPKRDASWALAAATRWWGDRVPAARARTIALAKGRAGDPSSVSALVSALRSEPRGAWRAATASVLELYTDRSEVRAALVAAMSDADPLVRFASAGSLSPVAGESDVVSVLEGALADPVRCVRIAAARALRFELSPGNVRAAEYVTYLSLASDTPTGLLERGSWSLLLGDSAGAVRDLARAVQLDPRSPMLRDAHAVALATYGRPADAAAELKEAVLLSPDDAGLHFRLALALAGSGDLPGAEAALDRAVALDAQDARAWYNLGLVRQQLGRGKPAIDALKRAINLSPDAETHYALATTLLAQGHTREAHDEAMAVLALEPGHAGATQIRTQTE